MVGLGVMLPAFRRVLHRVLLLRAACWLLRGVGVERFQLQAVLLLHRRVSPLVHLGAVRSKSSL